MKYINLGSVDKASKVIYACTILHNFIINRENVATYNTGEKDNDNSFSAEVAQINGSDHIEGNDGDMDGAAIRRNLTALFCS